MVAENGKSGLATRDYIDVAKLIRWWQRILSSPTCRVPAQLPIIIIGAIQLYLHHKILSIGFVANNQSN